MEPSVQSYSVLADALSKFHTAPEWIQALWLVTVPVTVVGASACLTRAVKHIAAALARRGASQGVWQGSARYAIYQDADGRLMLYACGTVRELPSEEAVKEALLPPFRQH